MTSHRIDVTTGRSLWSPEGCRVRAYDVTVESEEGIAIETYPVTVERGRLVLHL